MTIDQQELLISTFQCLSLQEEYVSIATGFSLYARRPLSRPDPILRPLLTAPEIIFTTTARLAASPTTR